MSLQSMTGFSRSGGQYEKYRWTWELRSVNGKSLDVRLRLPPGFEQLETDIRKRVATAFSRGNMQVQLSVTIAESRLQLVVNDAALEAVFELKEKLGDLVDPAPMTIDRLLNIRGIAEFRESDEVEESGQDDLHSEILASLDAALTELTAARLEEGAKIAALFDRQIDEIEKLTQMIENDPSREPKAIARRLGEQMERLLEGAAGLDRERLYAEAVLLATKADLREEIDRLTAHVSAARAMLYEGGPCGRRLDFLAQEFNRETNTICSKSNAVAVTAAGLELKTVIDQFREQVQNLE